MSSSPIDRLCWPSHVAALLITAYQQYLSPLKGYSCAHRVLYGDESCSQYVKQRILRRGLSDAWPDSRQRFRDCRSAYSTIMASRNDQDLREYEEFDGDRSKNKRNSRSCNPLNSNNCRCSGDSFEIFNFPCIPEIIEAIDCDLLSCDLAGCDIGGCDIGGCDVGGC
ncbi:MAG: membrane protein insertion efficiency factor YidD [Alkalinema sp. CAN_BIN05]|nr:membrane protein insertion efficiency factor YidD [Alkalinema sp. CAN_BIN05]